MMFSSNQELKISGSLGQLEAAIDFAMMYSGHKECFVRADRPAKCLYQITKDGRYCIGWGFGEIPEGWTEYPFDYDAEIISGIVRQYIEKAEWPFNKFDGYDGSTHIGFLLHRDAHGDDVGEVGEVKSPFYCIVNIRPFWCYYAK